MTGQQSLLGRFHLSARCGLTQQASFQSLWTSVPAPHPSPHSLHTLCSVGPGLNPYSLQQSWCQFTQDHLGPPGGCPDAESLQMVADQWRCSHPPWA